MGQGLGNIGEISSGFVAGSSVDIGRDSSPAFSVWGTSIGRAPPFFRNTYHVGTLPRVGPARGKQPKLPLKSVDNHKYWGLLFT